MSALQRPSTEYLTGFVDLYTVNFSRTLAHCRKPNTNFKKPVKRADEEGKTDEEEGGGRGGLHTYMKTTDATIAIEMVVVIIAMVTVTKTAEVILQPSQEFQQS